MVYPPCMPHILFETLKYFFLRTLYLVAYKMLYVCVCVCALHGHKIQVWSIQPGTAG